ncbi:DUF58 domain-containing protein [ANME-2 cluster archaeon]|nr:MAG: DUF58 domain-containing protein [ANME-2 cluster archaeon]
MIDTDFFNQLNRFSLMVRKRVSSVYAGSRRSVLQGKGIEIVGYREYMPGDDIRTIDWRVYGRTDKLYIRKFEEEKNVTTHILLDSSKSMDFSSNGITKFDYAAMLACGFGYLVTRENEKFAISTFGENIDINPPKRGRGFLLHTIDKLNQIQLDGKTRFDHCTMQYEKMIRSKSIVIVISDFLTDLDSIRAGLYRLSANDLIIISVFDPAEYNLTIGGDVKLYDMETGEVRKTYISPKLKEEYRTLLDNHFGGIRETCMHIGADFLSFGTDVPIFDAFFEAVKAR